MKHPIILHTNTEYSFLSSTIKINELFELILQNKSPYLTLTDKENFFALPMFLDFAQKHNLKLIAGIELTLENDKNILVYAKNYQGYVFINELILMRSENISVSLSQLNNPNILLINHPTNGFEPNEIEQALDNFYFNSKQIVGNFKTVYAPLKKVLYQNENEILHILNQIAQKNQALEEIEYTDYFDSNEFNNVDPQVLEHMQNFVNLIEPFTISNEIKLASFENPKQLLLEKLNKNKYVQLIKRHGKDVIDQRINYELDTIEKLNFINYFLVIKDVLDFAASQKIEVGPGRGSSSGSIIAFLLDITNVNPIEYGLLFERFLNVARVSLPDIDIDIQDDRRNELLEYIAHRFGKDKCALISTFQTLALKSSLRDVARVLKISLPEIDKICDSLSKFDVSLDVAYERNAKYKMLVDKHEKLHQYARKIEGMPRQSGIHAAGVIISDRPLTQVVPVRHSSAPLNQVEFEMNNLEQYGLIKIDFLGLKNLTVINQIESQISEQYRFDQVINLNFNPYNDRLTFDLINSLNTDGIFQLESPGMKSVIKKVQVDTFEDIYAIISLFRPGPKDFIPIYADVKFDNKKIESIHPMYDLIVAPTYGIIVYQEQIMQIAQQVAKMSFIEADLMRRAISKKNAHDLSKYSEIFYQKGIQNNIDKSVIEQIYNQILKFALYGFNKAHAVAYSFITYKLAFYKARYPEIFYKVIIDNATGDLGAIKSSAVQALKQNIIVHSPHINHALFKSEIIFKNVQNSKSQIYLPLLIIKGIGPSAVAKIAQELKRGGKIDNFFTGILRLKISGVGDAVIETLIKANVFRDFGNVVELINALPAINNGAKIFKDLYSKSDESLETKLEKFFQSTGFDQKQIQSFDLDLNLEIKLEKELLGSVFNVYPTKKYEREIRLEDLKENQNNFFYVFLENVNKNQKGQVRAKVSDSSGAISAFIFEHSAQDLIDFPQPRVILVSLYLSAKGYYSIKSWEEVKHE
ncbi:MULTISPECIES: DNA polymerase III subunit alpha [unclassified Mycoplasma]|uniref:DNA polymerase III subunit alpha n=1 Tax=unclassified Mycoplasma TaxID=2683645 RepID=UPI00211CEFCE|nr:MULTISPECIES: DNA polymerase III subunit alpha [unclassified Mycoplasma]UUM19584.1 DNA polymerase III subunit alpha [Mycoplasma sp. 1578d]UUM24503.1 DNA polymerase III subunit alpha [Mycoplasma sp. 3686d]